MPTSIAHFGNSTFKLRISDNIIENEFFFYITIMNVAPTFDNPLFNNTNLTMKIFDNLK